MKKWLVLILLLFAVFPKQAHQLKITEVMFDPAGDDHYSEYIELFNDENTSVNISSHLLCNYSLIPGYISKDANNTITTNTTLLPPYTYALVVDGGSGSDVLEKFNTNNTTYIFHTNTSYICGKGLNNDGMNITLSLANGSVVDSVNYTAEMDVEGYSIQLCNGSWIVALPTPLAENACNRSENSSMIALELKIENISCFICNESETINYRICAYPNTSTFGRDMNITVLYWISDLYGREVKKAYSTTLKAKATYSKICTSERSWTPPGIEGEVFFVEAMMVNTTSNTTILPDNKSSLMLIVRRKDAKMNGDVDMPSFVKIESVSRTELNFGDVVRVKLRANRGDNDKRTIYVYVKNPENGRYASEKLSVQLMEKNAEYVVVVPVQLKPNCDGRLKGGKYILWADASWGDADIAELTIKDGAASSCRKIVRSSCQCQTQGAQPITREKKRKVSCAFVEVENVTTPQIALSNSNISTFLVLHNKMNRSINLSAYSYIICGGKLATEGGWKGNEIDVVVENQSVVNITLMNVVKEVDEIRPCTLKVKLWYHDKNCVLEKPVFLLNFSAKQPASSHKYVREIKENYVNSSSLSSHNRMSSALIYDTTPLGKVRRVMRSVLLKMLQIL